MSLRDISLEIGRHAICSRAAFDGIAAEAYDAAEDVEGYAVSLLIALHHWSDAHGRDWSEELEHAEAHYEADLAEARHDASN
jgi:hypothetical protein